MKIFDEKTLKRKNWWDFKDNDSPEIDGAIPLMENKMCLLITRNQKKLNM